MHRHNWDDEISPLCTFCKECYETVIHILWECKYAQKIWTGLERWLAYVCKLKFKFKIKEIITNKVEDEIPNKQNRFIELIILISKQYIYASKCMDNIPTTITVTKKIFEMYTAETGIALQNNKIKKHENVWKNYIKYAL